jgi:phospholipase C
MAVEPTTNPIAPPVAAGFQKIQRFVVLMLENRSFDHLVGFLASENPAVAGLSGQEANYFDPNSPAAGSVTVGPATKYQMSFDPAHEFKDVQTQLYGPANSPAPAPPNPPAEPARMNGFLDNAVQTTKAAGVPLDAARIMECFEPRQLSVIATLAREFALFNFWYSSLPGPTWPNRFFIHAGTSGGLSDSPDDDAIIRGFSFANGTIYEKLQGAGKDWRIYHNGLPQSAGINSLRLEYINPFTKNFSEMSNFAAEVSSGLLPEYTFIEPNYDSGGNYLGGDSMHPLNDVTKGEALVKQVYEAIRNSPHWLDTMLIITFDEHGGFFDHVPPPAITPTGDDAAYANPANNFKFDRLGVRVPAIVISAYTQGGTIIGADATDELSVFDHASVLATIEKRFGLTPLTLRDEFANTLDIAVNLATARTDAPTALPDPAQDKI